jgi:hypothetical protein
LGLPWAVWPLAEADTETQDTQDTHSQSTSVRSSVSLSTAAFKASDVMSLMQQVCHNNRRR